MRKGWTKGVAFFLVVVLTAAFGVGCGGGSEGKVTITIGEVTDLTGPAATAARWSHMTAVDIVRYWNDENLIPGVKLKLATWDERFDPSRDVPGYDWVRERGAKVIYSLVANFCESLKPFAERDKIVICASGATSPMIEPPGWVFAFSPTYAMDTKTLLQWLSENDWDYSNGVPKIGLPAWNEPIATDMDKAIKGYCQDHPGKFDYVGAFLAPVGAVMWSSQVQKVRDCDYVVLTSGVHGSFVEQFRGAGYTTKFIGPMAVAAFRGFLVDMLGWDSPLDGMITTGVHPWWGEGDSYPFIKLAEDILHRYHSASEANEIIYRGGCSYLGTGQTLWAILEVVKAAVEEVGAENFDGQAFYNAALEYKLSSPVWEGYPQWGFTQTKRYWQDDEMIYEWSAEARDLVRISDWVPLVTE
ncbi:MAG: ABC transporter substrate-binding protein [Chloroflexi bacterium]|nr:ABC transporter substrate-binding protein [Chloroflexota bacterium]